MHVCFEAFIHLSSEAETSVQSSIHHILHRITSSSSSIYVYIFICTQFYILQYTPNSHQIDMPSFYTLHIPFIYNMKSYHTLLPLTGNFLRFPNPSDPNLQEVMVGSNVRKMTEERTFNQMKHYLSLTSPRKRPNVKTWKCYSVPLVNW